MKKTFIVLAAACGLLTSGPALAQREFPGQIGIQLSAGTVDGLSIRNSDKQYSFFGSIAMTRNSIRGQSWHFGFTYLQKDYLHQRQIIPKAQFTGEAGYFVPLFADRGHNIALKLGLAGTVGYETSN